MVIGGAPRLGTADQYGSAHAAPGALWLVVLIVVVVVVIILSRRGKLARGKASPGANATCCGTSCCTGSDALGYL
jgi:hypothetical protein